MDASKFTTGVMRTPSLNLIFASAVVLAEFHPNLKAIRFCKDNETGHIRCQEIFCDRALSPREELSADIADISCQLAEAVLPDYYAFCIDMTHLFNGAQPAGPIAQLTSVDWDRFRKISAYAQYWKSRNPQEVDKLINFLMALPLFGRLAGQLIVTKHNNSEISILKQLSAMNSSYLIGITRFKQAYRQEFDIAYNESKVLVSTFQGNKTESAAQVVNDMLTTLMTKQQSSL